MSPRPVLPAILACGLLAACASGELRSPAAPTTVLEQFAADVRPAVDEIQLAPNGGLSAKQEAAVAALAQRWRDAGQGQIVIQAPADGLGLDTGRAVYGALLRGGVEPESIRTATLEGGADSPVKVGFSGYEAAVPRCADHWTNAVRSGSNYSSSTFGCAITANMAVQVADPRDLAQPEPSVAAESRRRVTQVTSYREGKQPKLQSSSSSSSDVGAP